jgi:hypothetical protein
VAKEKSPVVSESPQCVMCKHLFEREFKCNAFVSGIPEAILENVHDHGEAYPGDQGIRFERLEQ